MDIATINGQSILGNQGPGTLAYSLVQDVLALQGTSKLIEVIELVKQRLHPGLRLTGIVPCLYDSRMRLAREVLSELRRYFPAQVFRTPISTNVKLAESPSFAKTRRVAPPGKASPSYPHGRPCFTTT